MSIELKDKIKPHVLTIFLAFLTLLFGAASILWRIEGFVLVPFTAAFLSALMCVEKRRIASVTISAILVIAEVLFGFMGYFSFTSLSAVALAILTAVFYLRRLDKFDSALYATLALAITIFASTAILVMHEAGTDSVLEAYDYFLELYKEFKVSVISSTLESVSKSGINRDTLSSDYLNEMFDAYLNCIVAFITVLAFTLTGISHKIFSKIVSRCSGNTLQIHSWRFMPSKPFAYFYFILAILSMFKMNTESALAVSIVNLYLIFTFVFAYIGYRFIVAMFRSSGKSAMSSNVTVIILIVLFSSFALQILAILGAFTIVKFSKINQGSETNKK